MKKFLTSTIILSIILLLLTSVSFANGNMSKDVSNVTQSAKNTLGNIANGARNVVGDTENTVENVAKDAKNTVTGSVNDVENSAENVANDTQNMMTDNESSTTYDATRTSTEGNFMGISASNWTWIILAIVGLAIVGLVWYYGAQYEHTNYSNDE